jgi:hypothetical protein
MVFDAVVINGNPVAAKTLNEVWPRACADSFGWC